MSHAMAEGLCVAALSKQWVMWARNGFMGCLGIISFFDGQHSLTNDGFTLLLIAVRNASTRGLTFGTIPSPSVSQEHPTDASATRCKQPEYASTHRSSLFSCLSRGSQCPISMLLGAGEQDAVWVAADHCQVDSKRRARCLVFVPPPSVSGQSKGQKWIISSLWEFWRSRIHAIGWGIWVLFCLPSHSSFFCHVNFMRTRRSWPRRPPTFLTPRLGVQWRQLSAPWLGLVHQIGLMYVSDSALAPPWKLYWQGAWWLDYRTRGPSASGVGPGNRIPS